MWMVGRWWARNRTAVWGVAAVLVEQVLDWLLEQVERCKPKDRMDHMSMPPKVRQWPQHIRDAAWLHRAALSALGGECSTLADIGDLVPNPCSEEYLSRFLQSEMARDNWDLLMRVDGMAEWVRAHPGVASPKEEK